MSAPFRFAAGTRTRFLAGLSFSVLAIILIAGLWPFHAPLNDVYWSIPPGVLILGKHGSLLSAAELHRQPPVAGRPCSLEIYLQPRRLDAAGTILAFYFPDSRETGFTLRQSLSDLRLESGSQSGSRARSKLYVDVFKAAKPIAIAIVSAEEGTSVYLDGVLARKSSAVRLSPSDLAGRIILGNVPSTTDSWPASSWASLFTTGNSQRWKFQHMSLVGRRVGLRETAKVPLPATPSMKEQALACIAGCGALQICLSRSDFSFSMSRSSDAHGTNSFPVAIIGKMWRSTCSALFPWAFASAHISRRPGKLLEHLFLPSSSDPRRASGSRFCSHFSRRETQE